MVQLRTMDTETRTQTTVDSGPHEKRARDVFGESFTPSEQLQRDLQNATDALNVQVAAIQNPDQFVQKNSTDVSNLTQQDKFPNEIISAVKSVANTTNIKPAVVAREVADHAAQNPEVKKNKKKLYEWILKLQAILLDKTVSKEEKQRISELHEKLAAYLQEAVVGQANVRPEDAKQVEETAKHWDEFVGSHLSLQEYERIVSNRQKMRSLQNLVRTPDGNVSGLAFEFFSDKAKELIRRHDMLVDLGDAQGIIKIYDELHNALLDTASIDESRLTPEDRKLLPNPKELRLSLLRALQDEKNEAEAQVHVVQEVKKAAASPQEQEMAAGYDKLLKKSKELTNQLGVQAAKFEQLQGKTPARSKELENLRQKAMAFATFDADMHPDMGAISAQLRQVRDAVNGLVNAGRLSAADAALASTLSNYVDNRLALIGTEEDIREMAEKGGRKEVGYYLKRFNQEEVQFIDSVLSRPAEILRQIRTEEGFNKFEKRIKKIHNAVFKNADLNTDQQFEHVFTAMYHVPAVEDVVSMVQAAEAQATDRPLQDRLRVLRSQLNADRILRSYTHNASYILQTRGELETLAGFSEKLQAANLEEGFKKEPLVQRASEFLLQKVNQTLSADNWVVSTEFMLPDPDKGGVLVDLEVEEMLKKFYATELKNKEIQDWELQRAYRIAKGVHLAGTGEILDRIGEARAPVEGEYGAYMGYYGEKIGPIWDIMNHFYGRWGIPNVVPELMYALIRGHGTLEGWEHKHLESIMEKMQSLRGSKKVQFLHDLGGVPFIEIRNLFKAGALPSRHGWRADAATLHLLVDKDKKTFSQPTGAEKDYAGVDWEQSGENFKRAGTYVMWHWAKSRAENVAKLEAKNKVFLSEKQKDAFIKSRSEELTTQYKREAIEHAKKVNPMKFAFFEKEEMFDPELYGESVRGKALVAVFKDEAKNYLSIRDKSSGFDKDTKALHVEDNVIIVQSRALMRARKEYDEGKNVTWGITEADYEVIVDPTEREQAKTYHDALQSAISEKKMYLISEDGKGLGKVPMVEWFARKPNPFGIGSEDTDWSMLKFKTAGGSLIGRTFKDANDLNSGVTELMNMENVLIAADVAGSIDPIVEWIGKVSGPVAGVHSAEDGSKVARIVASAVIRYYDTDKWWRLLPRPIRGLIGQFFENSMSVKVSGKKALRLDEAGKFEFIEKLRQARIVLEHDAEILKKEVGAREWTQVYGVDFFREYVPAIFLLILLQAMLEEAQQSE